MKSSQQLTTKLFNWTNASLALIFILFSGFIICQSILHPDGYVTSDSAHYLQMAKNLLAGNGMETPNFVNGMSTYFATWPIGYPVLIAGASLLTGLNVFWATKLVNILIFGLCLILLQRLFKDRAPVVAMIFFVSTFTTDFAYSWSEVPFFLGMIWLVFAIARYLETEKNIYAVHMMLAALFLFFMRYIGLIGAGIVGLVGFYYLFQKKWRSMIVCWVAGSIPILLAFLYLLKNYAETGLFTGMERIPRAEGVREFFSMLYRGVLAEVNILATSSKIYLFESFLLILIAVIIFVRPRHIKGLFTIEREQFIIPLLFLLTGAIYFIAIVYMRWNAHFDPFNFRLLGPATLMAWLFIAGWIAQLGDKDWIRWRNALLLILSIAFIMNIGYRTYTSALSPSPDYAETKQIVEEKYAEIPSGSIVIFENIHARYLRPDLQYIKVHLTPYFATKETVEEFLERISDNQAVGVYVEVHPIREDRYHESFVDLIKSAGENEHFIKLQ